MSGLFLHKKVNQLQLPVKVLVFKTKKRRVAQRKNRSAHSRPAAGNNYSVILYDLSGGIINLHTAVIMADQPCNRASMTIHYSCYSLRALSSCPLVRQFLIYFILSDFIELREDVSLNHQPNPSKSPEVYAGSNEIVQAVYFDFDEMKILLYSLAGYFTLPQPGIHHEIISLVSVFDPGFRHHEY